MSYQITITQDAEDQLRALPAREQRVVEAGIQTHLVNQPTQLSRALKQLRPNPFAQYELRLGDLRVLYNVDDANREVVVLLVGRKVGNQLMVGGQEFHGHQSNPPP